MSYNNLPFLYKRLPFKKLFTGIYFQSTFPLALAINGIH